MSAPALSLELRNELLLQLDQCCRFCGCREDAPCPIFLVRDAAGIVRLARSEVESNEVIPCSWFVEGVCNSPICIEKLLLEKRNNVLLFDASGRAIPRRRGGRHA